MGMNRTNSIRSFKVIKSNPFGSFNLFMEVMLSQFCLTFNFYVVSEKPILLGITDVKPFKENMNNML